MGFEQEFFWGCSSSTSTGSKKRYIPRDAEPDEGERAEGCFLWVSLDCVRGILCIPEELRRPYQEKLRLQLCKAACLLLVACCLVSACWQLIVACTSINVINASHTSSAVGEF